MRWNQSRLLALIFVILCIAYYLQIRNVTQYSFGGDLLGPRWFPTCLSVIGIFFSVGLWFEKEEPENQTKSKNGKNKEYPKYYIVYVKNCFSTKIAKVIWTFAGYSLIFPYIGFVASTTLLLTIFIKLAGEMRIWVCLSAGIIMTLSFYLGFQYFLDVHLPSGKWLMSFN